MPLTEISNADDDKKFGHLGVSLFFFRPGKDVV